MNLYLHYLIGKDKVEHLFFHEMICFTSHIYVFRIEISVRNWMKPNLVRKCKFEATCRNLVSYFSKELLGSCTTLEKGKY